MTGIDGKIISENLSWENDKWIYTEQKRMVRKALKFRAGTASQANV